MKYTLAIGLEYKQFRRPADVTIYIGDRMIDTFQLDKDLPMSFDNEKHVDDTLYWSINFPKKQVPKANLDRRKKLWSEEGIPSHYRIYELEHTDLDGTLRLDVQNSDNDYTNGFMKNNSLIRFPVIALFPKHFQENRSEKLIKAMAWLDRSYEKYKSRNKIVERSDLVGMKFHSYWPIVREHTVLDLANGQSEIERTLTWKGGNFVIEIPIRKKHRIHFLGSPHGNDTGFFWPDGLANTLTSIVPIINTFDEDQRSNNT